jgi:acyl carrier protein
MTEADIYQKLTEIFREIFLDDTITAGPDVTAADVERWDSLTHIDMMMMVESGFGLRIPTRVITGMKNVGELVAYLKSKKG